MHNHLRIEFNTLKSKFGKLQTENVVLREDRDLKQRLYLEAVIIKTKQIQDIRDVTYKQAVEEVN